MHFLCEYNQMRFTSRWNWNLEMLVFMEGGKPENPEKNPRSKDENQQQTQPTYDTGTGNRTRATLVEGECSHHCAIPAPARHPCSRIPPLRKRQMFSRDQRYRHSYPLRNDFKNPLPPLRISPAP